MLHQLVINDLAVIDQLDIDLASGMTVLTGETGAGKSILLDALGLILGDRADTTLIRGENNNTEVTAIFSLANLPGLRTKLAEMDLNVDDELYIRRIVSRDGRSRAYLNNSPVPIQVLREIGESLIEIHGQHAHQTLARSATQRQLLDNYGDYNSLQHSVLEKFNEWKSINNKLTEFNHVGDDYDARLNLLRYQIDELRELNIGENEFAELSDTHKRLSHSQQLLSACQTALAELSESDRSIDVQLSQHQRNLSELSEFDDALVNIAQLLGNAHIQIEEAVLELRDYLQRTDTDPEQLISIEQRLDKLHELARKHKVNPESLYQHMQALEKELSDMEQGQDDFDSLSEQLDLVTQDYFKLANDLSSKRGTAADDLSEAVTEKMHELGIAGSFQIDVVTETDNLTPREHGIDKITFMVSTNPGQPLKPLNKIASGGELSRLSLAIQIISSSDNDVPTMIFDEVDTGISGGIAEVVGKLLSSLAEQRQILCVTHLAQVASCGDHHLLVEKRSEAGETFTQVNALNKEQRINEIARMLAGMKITDESRANAEKMLEVS